MVCLFKAFAFSQLSINGVAEFRELLMVMCCHFWQVCSFLETRKRVLNRQQNRLWTYQGSGIGSMGGFERVSGGTGVFHPRVLNTTTTTSNPQVKNKQGELLFLCSAVRSFDFVLFLFSSTFSLFFSYFRNVICIDVFLAHFCFRICFGANCAKFCVNLKQRRKT